MANKIVDSTGKTVGAFISFIDVDSAFVQFRINSRLYILPVYQDRIGDEDVIQIYYTTNDCSGQVYIQFGSAPVNGNYGLFPRYFLTPFGWVSSTPDGVTTQVVDIASENDSSNAGCEAISIPDMTVITLQQALGPDFRAGFTPPFRFE